MKHSDKKRIARIVEDAIRQYDEEDSNGSDKPMIGGWRILSSRFAYFVLAHWRKVAYSFLILILLGFSMSMFGIYHILFTILLTVCIGAFVVWIKSKDKVYIIEILANKDTQDSFKVYSMSRHLFNQFERNGDGNPINTLQGQAYVVEFFDRVNMKMTMSYRHYDLAFWYMKNAFPDMKEKAIDLSNKYEVAKLMKSYEVHEEARKRVKNVVGVIDDALFHPQKSKKYDALDSEEVLSNDKQAEDSNGSDKPIYELRDGKWVRVVE